MNIDQVISQLRTDNPENEAVSTDFMVKGHLSWNPEELAIVFMEATEEVVTRIISKYGNLEITEVAEEDGVVCVQVK